MIISEKKKLNQYKIFSNLNWNFFQFKKIILKNTHKQELLYKLLIFIIIKKTSSFLFYISVVEILKKIIIITIMKTFLIINTLK